MTKTEKRRRDAADAKLVALIGEAAGRLAALLDEHERVVWAMRRRKGVRV